MYPKFLLLPKGPKSNKVQKAPHCKQYELQNRRHSQSVQHRARSAAVGGVCACIKCSSIYFCNLFFIIKQVNILSTINNPLGAPRGWLGRPGGWRVGKDDQGQDGDTQRKRPPGPHGAAECFW